MYFLLPDSWTKAVQDVQKLDKATEIVRELDPTTFYQELCKLGTRWEIKSPPPTEVEIERLETLQQMLAYEAISSATNDRKAQRIRINNAIRTRNEDKGKGRLSVVLNWLRTIWGFSAT